MAAKIIDGEAVASRIREEIKATVAERVANNQSPPGLATVLVGENPASQQYVRMKQRRCKKVGIESFGYTLPAESTQEEVEKLVGESGSRSQGQRDPGSAPLTGSFG